MAHTHELTFHDGNLTKRYTSSERGEHRHAPGLEPRPVSADLDSS